MDNEVKVENEVKEEPVKVEEVKEEPVKVEEVKEEPAKVEKKGNKGLIFLLVLIIITLLGVIGYLAFSKDVFGFKLSKDTSGNTSSVVKNNSDSKMDTIKVASPDERYSEYLKNLEKNLKTNYSNDKGAHITSKYIYKNISYDKDCYNNFTWYINDKLELILNSESKYLSSGSYMTSKQKDVKVADNVLDIFIIETGLGDRSYYLYFIKTDGSVYRVNWKWSDAKGVVYGAFFDIPNIKKLDVKNVVYVANYNWRKCPVCEGDNMAVFVDIDGNVSIDEYLAYGE